jgi:hypothetical protein
MKSVSSCGQNESADHGDAERLTQLGAGAGAQCDRQRAEDRRKRRHHDRPEAQKRRLADCGLRAHAHAPPIDREVDHHDGVLLDDTDQHDDADHSDDRQVHVEHHETSSAPTPAEGKPEMMVIG